MKLKPIFSTILCTLLLTGCATCGPAPTPTPTPLPVDIAQQAGDQMLTVQSMHFVIDIDGELSYLDLAQTIALKHVEGDVQRPDRVRAIVRMVSFGITSEVGIIGLGDEQYITNPLNQRWERIPPGQGWYFDPAILFDPEYGIEAVLNAVTWAFVTPEEPTDAYVLQAHVPGERLLLLTSGMITGGDTLVNVWVDRTTYYVEHIEIIELDSDPEDPTYWQLSFSDFDQEIDIQAPPLEEESP